MKIALITCDKLPQGVIEDQPLYNALKRAAIEFHICIWDQTHDWSQYDVCLLRSVWDYHEKSEAFMVWVQQVSQVTRLLNPAEVIEWNSNKNYLKELAAHQLNIAPTVWLTKGSDINLRNEIVKLPESPQYFLKPTIGADSSGTHRFNVKNIDAAQEHLNHWLVHNDMMLQSYLPSVESYGEISAISAAAVKLPCSTNNRKLFVAVNQSILVPIRT